MSEIQANEPKNESTPIIKTSQEQFRKLLKEMMTCYEEKVLGRKACMRDMSIEELLRFTGFAMRFDAQVLDLIADELKERGLSDGYLPSKAIDSIRSARKKDKGIKFWRAKLAK